MAHHVLCSHTRMTFPEGGRFSISTAFRGAVIALSFPETALFNRMGRVFPIGLWSVKASECDEYRMTKA